MLQVRFFNPSYVLYELLSGKLVEWMMIFSLDLIWSLHYVLVLGNHMTDFLEALQQQSQRHG